MHVFQTEGEPPKRGKIILANMGSIQNNRTALMNKENAYNKSKLGLLFKCVSNSLYYKITYINRIKRKD
jgi:hypothetical protein